MYLKVIEYNLKIIANKTMQYMFLLFGLLKRQPNPPYLTSITLHTQFNQFILSFESYHIKPILLRFLSTCTFHIFFRCSCFLCLIFNSFFFKALSFLLTLSHFFVGISDFFLFYFDFIVLLKHYHHFS